MAPLLYDPQLRKYIQGAEKVMLRIYILSPNNFTKKSSQLKL